MKKFVKYGPGGLAAVLILGAAGFYFWTRTFVARPAPAALAALVSGGRVAIDDGAFVVFRPADSEPTTGLILYPAAACDVRGYAPLLRRIAERGYLVVGVPMPLNLAVFAPGRADDVRAAFPAVQRWVIAGHAMGGSMAARYAHRHPDDLAGLILWDAVPAESDTLVDLKYPVWEIHRATADGRPPEALEHNRNLFPATSTWIPVPGGSHMYFGSFISGGYKDEWTATISQEAQHDLVVTGTLNALLAMSPPVP